MNNHFFVNNDVTHNPGSHHEVHTKEHAEKLRIKSKSYVGYFANEIDAVEAAKKIFLNADGCAICCPKAHKG